MVNLQLDGNNIKCLSPLRNLKNLSYLNLNSNKIECIEDLSCLINLEQLCLNDNMIKDISDLKNYDSIMDLSVLNQRVYVSNFAGSKINGYREDSIELHSVMINEDCYMQDNEMRIARFKDIDTLFDGEIILSLY